MGIPIIEIYNPVYTVLETIVTSKLKEDRELAAARKAAAQSGSAN